MTKVSWHAVFFAFLFLKPIASVSQVQDLPQIVLRANAEFEKGNFNEALTLYQQALREVPPKYQGSTNIQIGACYALLKRNEEAIATLTKPDWLHDVVPTFLWLGYVHAAMREYSEAALDYQKVVDFSSEQCTGYPGLADMLSHAARYDEAQLVINRGSTRTCDESRQQELRDAQLLVYLGKGMYQEATRLSGQTKRIYAEIESAQGGVRIAFVPKGSPAQLAGLEQGDIIVTFNGEPVGDLDALRSAVNKAEFGASVPIHVKRDGNDMGKKVIIGILPNLPELAAATKPGILPSTPAATSPSPSAVSPAAPPFLSILGVEVKPSTVTPGQQFSMRVSCTADATDQVSFSYAIHKDGQRVFESGSESISTGRARQVTIDKTLTAAGIPGEYAIRVRLASGDKTAEAEAVLIVIKR